MLAVCALAPMAAFGQQESAAQSQTTETSQATTAAKTEDTQGKTEAAPANTEKDRNVSGMSILGNQDAPKSLVIVPWKSSEIGKSLSISTMLDDSRQPIDKEVFMRVLSYFEVSSKKDGAPAANTPAATAAQGRK